MGAGASANTVADELKKVSPDDIATLKTELGRLQEEPASTQQPASAEELQKQVDAFFKRRAGEGLGEAFDKYKDESTGELPVPQMGEALTSIGIRRDDAEVVEVARVVDANNSGGITRAQFIDIAKAPTALDQWAGTLPMGELLSACLPRKVGDPLELVGSLSEAEVEAVQNAFSAGFKRMFGAEASHLKNALDVTKKAAEAAEGDGKVSKFSTFKMSCGAIGDFHAGLQARVGAPSLEFMKAMKAEHCLKGGCDYEFCTSNYGVTTTPKKEWEITLGERECPEEDMGHGRTLRRVAGVDGLLELPLAKEAGLEEVEVIAIVLYTGPMFQVYNAVLRQFPKPAFDVFEASGNLFSTTIHVLVSAIQKVARVVPPPEGSTLYCGLGGLMELPDQFWAYDSVGCRGYMEWGFRSTTSNRAVALQYSGAKQGRPLAMVLEIPVGSVDRGACIKDFSQYPAEVEYLWVPCSYIEPVGNVTLQVLPEGVVKIINVRMNANLKALTIDQLVGQKKQMHLGAFRLMLDETKHELAKIAEEGGVQARFEKDKYYEQMKESLPNRNGESVVPHILDQCNEVYKSQEGLSTDGFSNDLSYRSLIGEMLDTKKYACSKLAYWFEDESLTLQNIGLAMCSTSFDKAIKLRDAHLGRLTFLKQDMKSKEDGTDEQKAAALKICKVQGLVTDAIDEENERGETPFLLACMRGCDYEELVLLKLAGADIDHLSKDKDTALSRAINEDNVKRIKELKELGVDFNRCVNGVMTPVMLGVGKENQDLVKLLVECGGSPTKGKCGPCNPINAAKGLKDDGKMLELLKELAKTVGEA